MNSEIKKGIDYGKFGIIIGACFVIMTIIWVLKSIVCDDDTSAEEVTWVG